MYDFLLTFDREVEQIWKAPWTLMKGAYILQRYLPLFDTVYINNASLWTILYYRLTTLTPNLVDGSTPNITPETCLEQYTANISTLSPLSS
jgi:hypothetical protein